MNSDVIPTLYDPPVEIDEFVDWSVQRFGLTAHEWMAEVADRMGKDDVECEILWQHLENKWHVACEPNLVNGQFYNNRAWDWMEADYFHCKFVTSSPVRSRYTTLVHPSSPHM